MCLGLFCRHWRLSTKGSQRDDRGGTTTTGTGSRTRNLSSPTLNLERLREHRRPNMQPEREVFPFRHLSHNLLVTNSEQQISSYIPGLVPGPDGDTNHKTYFRH